ncbi:LacI family DNA-binding transcriptional regulator [Ottowia thiooxydans]|uniref:LacI family DNA-binding transcriptional regulator n=1 Tax=Ottowia thiooxydans TaxID=219182 RepID=UPI000568DD3E|nr:LacI family DNA-binding transcriptional regulator [Ottowia thiooxydans]
MKATIHAGNATVTIRNIADDLAMSHSTVSRALADHPNVKSETKLRVQARARELGYVPNGLAQSMRGTHGPVLGLVIPDIRNEFYASMAQIVADAAAARGFHLALSITEDDPDREMGDVRALLVSRAAGVIITPSSGIRAETLDMLRGVNAAQLVRHHPGIAHEAVLIDDFAGVASATRHLVNYGHRRIAYVGTHPDISCGLDRHEGFRTVMAEHGLDASHAALGPPRPEFAQHAVTSLLAGGTQRPTALVVGSSSLTIGALEALRGLRLRWPEDISVVGYGDPVWFKLIGDGLTTVQLPVQDMGRYATSLLLMRFEGSSTLVPSQTGHASRFAPSLVVRGSTAICARSPL